ncbi:MAG: trans-aconitate 2-methyltransferase [SAR202 cluster bacterium Io17-Chloro-G2]|nr:MAG: trans-aconitate 2-methyltransferase [SAR202 cluster bacterium Io17-Chloro-G2]
MTSWNPSQYLRFGNERLQPVIDLIGRIPLESPGVIYDLGCGTGSGTVILKERWPGAQVTGVDSSESMLERTRTLEADVSWQHSDLNVWEPAAPADLIFSNAVFHWLDDHHALFPRLMSKLAPGGILAVQMPLNWRAPTHRLIAETVRGGPWRGRLEPHLREFPVLEGQKYYDLLSGQASSIDMWETTYYHILEGQDPVVEWTKGSILRPLLDLLEEPEAATFLEMYRSRIAQAYPQQADAKTVLPFRRLFFMAAKS